MILHAPRSRPEPWRERRKALPHWWMVPLHAVEYPFDWLAYFLSRWAFLETLEYLGSFSILIAVIFYFSESGDRLKQKHYQAWQVINTAQGKGGSGGRVEALQELNMDGVPLVGVDVAGAFLQGVRLPGAELSASKLQCGRCPQQRLQARRFQHGEPAFGELSQQQPERCRFARTRTLEKATSVRPT